MSKVTDPKKVTVTGRLVGGGVFNAKKKKGEPPERARYSACVVLDQGKAELIDQAAKAAIEEKWGNKPPKGLMDWTVREGDDEEFPASFGKEFINPKSQRAPEVLVKRGELAERISSEDQLIYAGCYVAVSVSAYAYDGDRQRSIKPGVTLNLRAVMFVRHGDPLGDVVNVDSEFAGIESANYEDMFGDNDVA